MHFKIIKNTQEDEFQEIQKFVSAHPDSTYFQSPLFFKSCVATGKLLPAYIVAYSENSIAGVLLVFRQIQINKPVLSFLSSRNIIWGGPLVSDNNPDVYNGLFKKYEALKPRALYTQVRNLHDMSCYKESMNVLGFSYEEHLNILIDLKKPEEELWNNIDPKGKNKIRKAEKEGTSFEMKNDETSLIEAYKILKEVYHRAKLPLPDLDHFQALFITSDGNNGLKIFLAKDGSAIIGCMLCLAYEHTLFCYYAGAYASYYKKLPNDLLPWEVFKWGKKMGYTLFDFGGAGKPNVSYGVREYKKKFGGVTVNYGRFEKIHMPMLYSIAKRGLAAWQYLKK